MLKGAKRPNQPAFFSSIIISNAIAPRFKAGDFNGGVTRGVDDIITTLSTDSAEWKPKPADMRAVTREAMVQSALLSAGRAEEMGMPREKIILSAKVSAVQDLIAV